MADQTWPRWVIKEVAYFDHATHRFVAGDLEIAGERIAAIKAPGSSTCETAIDGRAHVCTPGLVVAVLDSNTVVNESERLLRAGITRAGILCDSASACIAAASKSRLHLTTRLLLNPLARACIAHRRPGELIFPAELQALQRIDALLHRHRARLALAMHCASVVSAYELVYAQRVAAALGLNLGFELSDDEASARAFRERFCCDEAQLLDFLRLLGPGITVSARTPLTHRDCAILARTGANVTRSAADALRGHRSRRRRHTVADLVRTLPAVFPQAFNADAMQSAQSANSSDLSANADRLVDALTIAAAASLGQTHCGRIAPDMFADLCLFPSPGRVAPDAGSETFVHLLDEAMPDSVIVAGASAHGALIEDSRRFPPIDAHGEAPARATLPRRASSGNIASA